MRSRAAAPPRAYGHWERPPSPDPGQLSGRPQRAERASPPVLLGDSGIQGHTLDFGWSPRGWTEEGREQAGLAAQPVMLLEGRGGHALCPECPGLPSAWPMWSDGWCGEPPAPLHWCPELDAARAPRHGPGGGVAALRWAGHRQDHGGPRVSALQNPPQQRLAGGQAEGPTEACFRCGVSSWGGPNKAPQPCWLRRAESCSLPVWRPEWNPGVPGPRLLRGLQGRLLPASSNFWWPRRPWACDQIPQVSASVFMWSFPLHVCL